MVGKSIARVDIPPKLTCEFMYMQDFRLPGMLHARVQRPDDLGAWLRAVPFTPEQVLAALARPIAA